MPAPIIPWQPSNIPLEIQQELDRRKTVRSFDYIANNVAHWDNNGDWKSYKGPMIPWVRMCSNSAGHPAVNKPRFVFRGGKGFYDTYGFSQTSPNSSPYQIIGYQPTNPPTPHIIENSLRNPTVASANGERKQATNFPIHVPTPEISRVTVTIQKELFRRAEVEWTCFSWEQLVYMTPYFLVPRITVMLEWGWNHFNPISLVKLDDMSTMVKFWKNAYPLYFNNIIDSKGNYDVIYGIVTNFHWSMEGNRINCMTEITSKDRLYAGVSKDQGLTVNDKSNSPDEPRPLFQALRDFISKDATLLNLKTIAEAENPLSEVAALSGGNINNAVTAPSGSVSVHGAENQNVIWRDIIRPILSEPDDKVRGMKAPYIRGIFSGRPKKFFNEKTGLGKPSKYDFDKSNVDKLEQRKVWINMGMIVEILNYFSGLPGGKGEPMFQVDIMNTVIGGHPNLISCNRNVLIPNRGAPRAHFGGIGLTNFAPKGGDTGTPYYDQKAPAQPVSSPADIVLRQSCLQIPGPHDARGSTVCFRQNLDKAINFLRYRFPSSPKLGSSNLGYQNFMTAFAFPAVFEKNLILPPSPTGLAAPVSKEPGARGGNTVAPDVSGLLSNIYLSYSAFVDAVLDPDPKMGSYVDVYKKILSVLNDSVDGFWDLALVEVEQTMTIVDKNYIGVKTELDTNPTYTFDYFDSDSIIRSFRFRPALTDAQATRAIYGEVNNSGSRYVYVDKNDLLDYKFQDTVLMNAEERKQGDTRDSDIVKRSTARQQVRDIIGEVQKLSTSEDDDSLQMTVDGQLQTIYTGGQGGGFGYVPVTPQEIEVGPFEYLKLCLPSSVAKQMFRLLIDDKDEDNNPRYCAIQPGITAELTILGCGGLRTFQYFLVKNLPAPYSHRDIIFRIIDVTHNISQEQAGWETKITAGVLPLKNYIKQRLVPPKGGWVTVVNPTIPSL